MGGFMYALAGGAYAVGDAWSESQKKQQTYELTQKAADAEMIRKQNFARFGINIDRQKAQNQSDIALEQYKGQQEVQSGYKGSGLIDPKTGIELDKNEIQKRGNTTGLVPKTEWDAENRTKQEIKSVKTKKEAVLAEAAATYGEDSEEYKAIKRKQFGLTAKVDDWTSKDVTKMITDMKKDIIKAANKRMEGGASSNAAEAKSTYEIYSAMPKVIQQQYLKDNPQKVNASLRIDGWAKEVAGMSPMEAEDYLKRQYEGKIPKNVVKVVLEVAAMNNSLGDSSMWEDVKTTVKSFVE